jgi:hypothetical protein
MLLPLAFLVRIIFPMEQYQPAEKTISISVSKIAAIGKSTFTARDICASGTPRTNVRA